MDEFIKLKDINLPRLNHAELAYFMGRFAHYIGEAGAEALHVRTEELDLLRSLVERMTDEMGESTICMETSEILELVNLQRKWLTYMRSMCRLARKLPIESKRQAAARLYPQLIPHVDPYHTPQQQFVQLADAVVFDLTKEENVAYVSLLNFDDVVTEMQRNSQKLSALLMSRTQTRVKRGEDSAMRVRRQLCSLYSCLSTYIWAQSIVNPSPELTNFISRLNKLIADTRASYNRRKVPRKPKGETAERVENVGETD